MADVILSAELQARVDQFVSNLLEAANAVSNTGAAVTKLSENISRNIANVNRQNISAFTAAIQNGTLGLEGFSRTATTATTNTAQSFSRLSTSVSANVANINRQNINAFVASLNAGTLAVQRFNQNPIVPPNPRPLIVGANQAANALTNLGRVAQDAPFGFIGIQNNLNPLLESFQRLRAETGSNSAAFRALGQSLLGPAGIGIALSLISSAILIYQQYQQRANKATQDAKKVTDDYVKSLEAVAGAQLKGTQTAQKEITDLRLLYQAYTNSNETLKTRQSAYKQLQELYPQYFGNIKFEKEATDKTKAAYDLLTQSIIATARARAASDKITQNESRKLENEQKAIDLQKEQLKNQRELEKARIRSNSQPLSGGSTGGVSTNISDLSRVDKIQESINENIKTQNNLKTDTNLLDKENGRLVTYVNTQLEKGGKLAGGFGDNIAKVKKELEKTNTNKLGGLNQDVGSLLGIEGSGEFTLKPNLKIEPIVTGISELQKVADKLNAQFSLLVENTLTGGLGNVAEGIGEALASGGNILSAVGESLLGTFSNFLSKFGELLIEYGAAAILKGKLDLAAFVPGAGIAAGIAAVAAGVALVAASAAINGLGGGGKSKNGKGGVTAFANGGIISGPTLGLMGEYAGAKSDPEVVAPLSKLKNLLGETDSSGNVIAKGGKDVIVLQSETVLRGKDLVIITKKAQEALNRIG